MDLAAANSATLNFNVIGNPLINGRGSNAINVFSDDSATVQGRINDNPDIQAGGSTSSGFGISAQANTNSNMTLEIDNNVISNIGFDAGIQVLSRLGAGRLDATISNNNVTVGHDREPVEPDAWHPDPGRGLQYGQSSHGLVGSGAGDPLLSRLPAGPGWRW